MKKNITLLTVIILTMLMMIPAAAYASDIIDFSRTGLLTVTITDKDKEPVSGAEVTAYKVADIVYDENTAYAIVLTKDFKGAFADFPRELEELSDSALTKELESYVLQNKPAGVKANTNSEGKAEWTDLDLGIYFVTSEVGDETYTKVASFCVTLPNYNDGNYEYDVNAIPKSVDIEEEPPVPVPPPIIQTGQLWWPVPVLAVLGLGLICFGFVIKKRRINEK